MLGIDEAFDALGATCFPAPGGPHRYYYLPLAATPQRDPDGTPQAHLLMAGETAFVQIAVIWDLPATRLEDLRAAIATRHGVEPAALVQLAFAPANVDVVALLTGDGAGTEDEIATTRSSGIAPHSAMFNIPLTGDDLGRAQAAFNGRPGFLQVRYTASLTAPISHAATLRGDFCGLETAQDIDAALADGRLSLDLPPDQSGHRDTLLARAAEMLAGLPADQRQEISELAIEITVDETLALEARTDVADWFDGTGTGVTPVDGPGFPPPPDPSPDPEIQVSLDIDGVSDLVSEVAVARGDAVAHLTAPGFAPVALPLDPPGAPIRVRTRYADGGADFEADVAEPDRGEITLTPEQLGLIEITVDAAPLVERGLDRLRTTLRYRPSDTGERRDETLHLREPPFTARWLVISRGEALGESLSYDLRATLTSGERLSHGALTAHSPQITLSTTAEE